VKLWAIVAAFVGVFSSIGCGGEPASDVRLAESALAGGAAQGPIPAGLPARVLVGLFEDTGGSWMRTSGVSWDARYRYLTEGWANNWGFGAYDGSFALNYLRECDQQGRVPAVQYYQIFAEPGGGESATLQKVQNATTMRSYFGDFKLLMQRVKDFGKPALVLLEADGVGFLEQQTNHNPNAYAAVADSGVPELAGLPNTVAGFGLAFLQLRKSVGAANARLGMHISAWASGKDIAHFNVTDALGPEVDKVYAFLAPLGLVANVTGQQYDVLVGDPLDRDADFYRLTQNQNRTWDPSDSAPIASRSFNRYAEWLRLWNVKAQKRWVLWQIPLGNSNHKNVWNNGGVSEGYKDNRPEYFFGSGTAHIEKFADAGVIALLFGAGAGGQSSYQNDQYTDGQLFMKSRAGALVNAGGVALANGAPPPPPPTGDTAQYGFETSAQGWTFSGSSVTSVARSTDRAFAGAASLKVNFTTTSGDGFVKVSNPPVPRGAVVTFRVFVPSGSTLSAIQPYVLQGAGGGWAWTGTYRSIGQLQGGAWNTLTVTVPSNAAALAELGVVFSRNSGSGSPAYVDTVAY
jgi:hypothetical protein